MKKEINETEAMQKEMDEIAKAKTSNKGPVSAQTSVDSRAQTSVVNPSADIGLKSPAAMEKTVAPAVETLPAAAFKASFTRDYKGLNDQDKARYVHALCKVLDISPALNPFYFLDMNGKTLLYAGIEAAQLLAESKKLNVEIRKKFTDTDTGLYTVEVRVQGPSGRFCDNEGIIHLGTMTGKDRANAMMKAVTKAQRRSILSYCGLSMTDDDDAQQGNYGMPANPLVERQQQILASGKGSGLTLEEVSSRPEVTKNVANQADQLTRKLRGELFKTMLGGKEPLFRNVLEFKQWIKLKLDKEFDQLTADECIELGNEIEEENSAAAADVAIDQHTQEPEGETHGLD